MQLDKKFAKQKSEISILKTSIKKVPGQASVFYRAYASLAPAEHLNLKMKIGTVSGKK